MTNRFDIFKNYLNHMNEKLHKILFILLLSSSVGLSVANAVSLDKISTSSLPGERVQIKFTLSETLLNEPLSFSVDNPARIVLDLPNTSLNLSEKSQTIGIGMANSLNAVEAGGRSRIVINLTRSVSYSVDVNGNNIFLNLVKSLVKIDTIELSIDTEITSYHKVPFLNSIRKAKSDDQFYLTIKVYH